MFYIYLAGFVGFAIGCLFSLWMRRDVEAAWWAELQTAQASEQEAVADLQAAEEYTEWAERNITRLCDMGNALLVLCSKKNGEPKARVAVEDIYTIMNEAIGDPDADGTHFLD